MTKPSQCGIDEMKDCDEGNQVDDDVRQKLDGHSGSVACSFYNIMLCTEIKLACQIQKLLNKICFALTFIEMLNYSKC